MRYTGAQLIVSLLEQQGITTVAGIPVEPRFRCMMLWGKVALSAMFWRGMSKAQALWLKAWPEPQDKLRSVWHPVAPALPIWSPQSPMPSSIRFHWFASPDKSHPQ